MNENENLTLQEAAEEYKCSVMTLRRRIKDKLLPASKALGKIMVKRRDIENLLKRIPAA